MQANKWTLSDKELGMENADPHQEFMRVLDHAPQSGLESLRSAIETQLLVRGVYTRSVTDKPIRGCLMYWLHGIKTKDQLLQHAFGSQQILASARRVMRFFDANDPRLDEDVMLDMLNQQIRQRSSVERPVVADSREPQIPCAV